MRLPRFDYKAPATVEEACRLLEQFDKNALVMAGGTDLLLRLKQGLVKPSIIIGLKKIKGLGLIRFDEKTGLTIGASALLAEVASHTDVLKHYPAVAYAANETANVQIRNMGTVAGNLCNGSPSADNAPSLMAADAEVTLVSSKGERIVPLAEFFKGPGLTELRDGEIMSSILIPPPPPGSGTDYQHISARGKVDISAVGVAVMLIMDGLVCRRASIVLGAVAPNPIHALEAENFILGKNLTPFQIEKAAITASKEARPISDIRATAGYRRKMVKVLTMRALLRAKQRAIKKTEAKGDRP